MAFALATFVACYGASIALVWTCQRRLVFPAPRTQTEPSVAGAHLLSLPGPSRVVHVLHVPATGAGPTIVHFHGNGESLAGLGFLADTFRARGIGFYAVEYPGYGLSSDASPSERAIYEDAEAALVHLRDVLAVGRERTVLEGQSLGTGVAVEMARRGHGSRLVLISPYTSIVDMARRALPFLPVSLLVRDPFDTAGKASSIGVPALVAHGTADEVIPFSMGERIVSLLPHARLLPLSGAHHNDVWEDPTLAAAVTNFVSDAR